LAALVAHIDGSDLRDDDVDVDVVFGRSVEFTDGSAPDDVFCHPIRYRCDWSPPDSQPSVYDRIGGFSSTTIFDLVEWMGRAADADVRVAFVDDITLQRRIHAGNMCHSIRNGRTVTLLALLKEQLDRRRAAGT
jgi:hypothetical protein